jgi:hypothetical protein
MADICPRTGRPQASGRRLAIALLDGIISEEKNQKKIREAMQEMIDGDAMNFMQKIVMPMTPNSMLEDSDTESAEQKAARLRAALKEIEATLTPPSPPTNPPPPQGGA